MVASVVFLWLGVVFTFVRFVGLIFLVERADSHSTFLLWHSIAHIDVYGPRSAHARVSGGIFEKPDTGSHMALTQPEKTHVNPGSFEMIDMG
jgi:hypothetical protein